MSTKLFGNDYVTIIIWFQSATVLFNYENDIVIVHFQMSPVQCGKHLMRFRSENAVFKFLRLGIDGVYKEAVFRTEVMRGTRV